MRPEVKIVLTLSRLFGSTPFRALPSGTVSFSWFSTAFFSLVLLIGYFHVGYAGYIFLAEAVPGGLHAGFPRLSWVGYYVVTSADHTLMVLKRAKIVRFLDSSSEIWSGYDKEQRTYGIKVSLCYFALLFLFGFLFPLATISFKHITEPSDAIFIYGYLLQLNSGNYIKWISWAVQAFVVTQSFLAILFSDFLPLVFCLDYARRFENINRAVVSDSNDKSSAIRTYVRSHYSLQRELEHFNDTFADFILIFLLQCFVMIVSLSYSAVKLPGSVETPARLMLFLSNVFGYLVRSTVVLRAFGKVQVAAGDVGRILTVEIGLEDTIVDANMIIFLTRAEKAGVSAGHYLWFTPAFILTFYGVLVSYVTLVVQSV